MNHIDSLIDDCQKTITFVKYDINFCHENGWDIEEKKKQIKFDVKVLKDAIRILESLKIKYEDKFECNERDYK